MATATLPADKFDTSKVFVRPDPLPNRAPLDKLAVLPGFNTRVKDDDYNERVKTLAESITAHGFFDDKPFAVTMIEGDDTIYIFDGEHRFDAAKIASLDTEFPDGLPIAWAKDGATVRDLTIHLAHGNNGERLNMVELASVVRRMRGLDMNKDEIAAALGRTTRHVDNLFVLADANATVRKAVASGKIAGAEAVKLLRKDKATAPAKIAEAIAKAEEKGKAKATPKTMGDSTPAPAASSVKMKTVEIEQSFPEGTKMGDVLKAFAAQIRGSGIKIGDDDVLGETGTSVLRLRLVDHEAEAAKAKAAEEKAAAAQKKADDKAAADAAKAATTKALAAAGGKAGDKAADEAKTPKRRTARPKADAAPANDKPSTEAAPAPSAGEVVAPDAKGDVAADSNNGL